MGTGMETYTAGFMFSMDRAKVALIIKSRPRWQEGKLNGIGGRVEKGETPMECQIRKFEEETGFLCTSWEPFIVLDSSAGDPRPWRVHFFHAEMDDLAELRTTTDEYVGVYDVLRLPGNIVPNLPWLVPLAALNEVTGNLRQQR